MIDYDDELLENTFEDEIIDFEFDDEITERYDDYVGFKDYYEDEYDFDELDD